MKTFIVTNPENGWNCVIGVYQAASERLLDLWLLQQEGYDEPPDWWEDCRIIHEKVLVIVP